MKKIWKYGVLPVAIFLFLLVVTVLLMPVLINVQQYVPEIEKMISTATGRPFSIGPSVSVSFFPSLSLTFSDLRLGNPAGFVSDSLVKINSFEARVDLLPLLKKEIRFSRFVVGGLEVNLETNTGGKDNWDFLRRHALPWSDFVENNVSWTLLAVTDGSLNRIDRKNNVRHSVDDLMLVLNDVRADRAFSLDFKASYDGKPLAMEGMAGPFRLQRGKEFLAADLGFHLLDGLKGQVRGKVENWSATPVYDIAASLSSFSPRDLYKAFGRPFPLAAGPEAFQAAEIEVSVMGRPDSLTVSKGTARIDDTRLTFSGGVKDWSKPAVNVALDVDRLDLDRYLPPGIAEKTETGEVELVALVPAVMSGIARNATLAGTLHVGELKVSGGKATEIKAGVDGKDGILTVDHASMKLYGGEMQANLLADLSGETPRMRVAIQAQNIDSSALLRETEGRGLITGRASGEMILEYGGQTTDSADSTDSGEPRFSGQVAYFLRDGAIPGIDLYRSVERGELVEAGPADDPREMRTDYTELQGEATLAGGLVTLGTTLLRSPAATLAIIGSADISARSWNLQVSPQGETPVSGKGESSPALVITGTLAKPALQAEDNGRHPEVAAGDAAKVNVASLVDEKIPSPAEEDVKDLVGKPLIDPAIVAQRFHLQRETIRRGETKKQLQLGSGKIRINPLVEETSLQ